MPTAPLTRPPSTEGRLYEQAGERSRQGSVEPDSAACACGCLRSLGAANHILDRSLRHSVGCEFVFSLTASRPDDPLQDHPAPTPAALLPKMEGAGLSVGQHGFCPALRGRTCELRSGLKKKGGPTDEGHRLHNHDPDAHVPINNWTHVDPRC